MAAVYPTPGTGNPSLTSGVDRVVIATYAGVKYRFDFILKENDVVVEAYKHNVFQGELNLNPSYKNIKAVPVNERSSSERTLKWFLNNQHIFAPTIVRPKFWTLRMGAIRL